MKNRHDLRRRLRWQRGLRFLRVFPCSSCASPSMLYRPASYESGDKVFVSIVNLFQCDVPLLKKLSDVSRNQLRANLS